MKALHDAHQATGEARLAAGIAALAHGQLVDIHDRYTRAVSEVAVSAVGTGARSEAPAVGGRGPVKPAEEGRAAAARRAARQQAMPSPLPAPLPGPREPGRSTVGHHPTRTTTAAPDYDRGFELD